MRILVTGSSGFLGTCLIDILLAAGHHVIAVTRNPAFRSGANTYVVENALESRVYANIIDDQCVDAVINTLAAGVDPSDRDRVSLIYANSVFPSELALAAKKAGARAFIHIGSSAEYANLDQQRPLREGDPLMQQKMYGATKAAGSVLLTATAEDVGLHYAVLRLFNIFGAGEKSYRLFPSLVRRLIKNETVSLSSGTQVRDFLHVDDASRSILKVALALLDRADLSGTYNLASGKALSVKDFAFSVARAIGADQDLLKFGDLPMRQDDLPYVVADMSRLNSAIGQTASTSMRDAVAPFLTHHDVEER